jgi:hypothetical protein
VGGDFNEAKLMDPVYIGRNNVVSWRGWEGVGDGRRNSSHAAGRVG